MLSGPVGMLELLLMSQQRRGPLRPGAVRGPGHDSCCMGRRRRRRVAAITGAGRKPCVFASELM